MQIEAVLVQYQEVLASIIKEKTYAKILRSRNKHIL